MHELKQPRRRVARVQAVARRLFAERTVLTIAHRLDTVIECDTVVVMEAGRVAETGPVCDLLQVRRNIPVLAESLVCKGACLH